MKWATRRRCHVDRAACAWLIRRFIDPESTFLFVDDPDQVPDEATPLAVAEPLFDGLYEYRRQALLSGRRPGLEPPLEV